MNWGFIIKRSFFLFLFTIVVSGNMLAREGVKALGAGDDAVIISDVNSKGLVTNQGNTLFKVKANYDGVITIDSDGLSDEIGLVTVFTNNYKTIVTQSLHRNEKPISFISKAGEVYHIVWQLKQDNIDIVWSVEQLEQKGINFSNAIIASEGLMEVNHDNGYDSWFAYTADRTGEVAFSSYGQTTENTCLFVYDKSCEIVIGSSNFAKGTLQSEVIVEVKEGETYYIKWSNAFTNAAYKWTLAYL
ncbi:hypothetical protein [Carboxylicivirga sp. RSCT41]|uniref:hypothetical protein n=1 Tax=Carboxylicivirga agarovorans TaxID=3417570 RepID=UPI003D326501